ncbi:sialidase family protein [Sediminibacterium soli]|uniref:sialidase family protein n=1 Tax=Sediminibacterium soli TaxID=2698829 RepID=UPI00137AD8B5|nr:sialidase family protein [Sediminibacterium soli]NCI45409.1 exo-alpha-sialidase [Sediminibacterium soli]
MKNTGLFLLCIACFFCAAAQQAVPVFVSGTEGHKSYRIPAILQLPGKDLIAFCEGRVNGAGDFGDINIVMKRSADGGKTWSSLQTIVDADSLQAGNPAPVIDLTDPVYPQGRIFLFYNTGNNHEGEVRKGKGLREVWYKTSVDNGQSWSPAVNITVQVHRPRQPAVNRAYDFAEDWRSYANTPGHAMQFRQGRYRGRIFVAANHSAGDPQKQFMDYRAFGFYTDDHGSSFHVGKELSVAGSNESMAAELGNSRLMMNSRNQRGDIRARIVSVSSDGGATWDSTFFDHNLPDPVNQGSLLNIGVRKGKNILAFCNAADEKRRDNLTLRISFDEGRTWARTIPIDKSAGNTGDFTAYSDLAKISGRKLGVLYERNGYREIVFRTVKWK